MDANKEKEEAARKQPLTIVDIARMAGLSTATISRVLNNSDSVKLDTKRKVLELIESVGYEPNDIARGLVTKTSKCIGLLIPDIMNSYYAEIISAIDAEANDNGFTLMLYITNEDRQKTVSYINEMIRRRVDGLILLSIAIEDIELIKKIKRSTAVVSVEADVEGVERISVENEKGTYEVIRHLLELGHREIGFLGYGFDLKDLGQRLTGYRKALNDYGVKCREEFIIEGNPIGNPGYDMANKILNLPHRPTAIHCINEYVAAGVYLAVRERGLRIPEDISVSAFDGLESSKVMYPRLTTAKMPIRDMGKLAVKILLDNMKQNSLRVVKQVIVPVEFSKGDSTGAI